MSFNTAPGRAEYTASAAQTKFTFPFKIFNTSDVKVYLTPAGQTADDTADILIETTDYTISINGDNGGDVNLTSGAASGDSITLIRSLPVDRDTEYQNNGDLQADTLNEDQDYQTYLILDGATISERALTVPDSVQSFDTEIPSPIPNKILVFNGGANGFNLLDPASTSFFNDAFIVDSIAAMLGVDPNVYGSVIARGYHSANDDGGGLFNYDASQSAVNNGGTVINGWVRQFEDAISLKQFGAVGDGVTNDTTQIQNALTYVSDKKELDTGDAGTTYLAGNLSFSAGIKLKGRATIKALTTNGIRPVIADVRATASAAERRTLLEGYYDYALTITGIGSHLLRGECIFENYLIKDSIAALRIAGNYSFLNGAVIASQLQLEDTDSILNADGLISVDSAGSGVTCKKGGLAIVNGAIFYENSYRGFDVLYDGIIEFLNGIIENSVRDGIFIQFNGTVMARGAEINNSGETGISIIYGGSVDINNGLVDSATLNGMAIESNGTLFGEGATISNCSGDGASCHFGGFIQLRDAVISTNGGIALNNLGDGMIYAQNATIGTDNGASPTSIKISAIGNGIVYAETPTFYGLADETFSPRYSKVGNGKAYIGKYNTGDILFQQSSYDKVDAQITSGGFEIHDYFIVALTEGGDPTDSLHTIQDSSSSNKQEVIISVPDSSRQVTVLHGAGNIITKSGANVLLSDANHAIRLIKLFDKWVEL